MSGDSSTSMSPEKTISNGIVAIYKRYLGRGPERARTVIAGGTCATTLFNSMTMAEATLVSSGDAELVREMRQKFQNAMRDDITELVERVTERKCQSFLSDHDAENDVAVEMVVFDKD